MKTQPKNKIKRFLDQGVQEGVFPGAVLIAARGGKTLFFHSAGYLSLFPKPVRMKKDTIFDLASLTKPLATTLALMKLADEGEIFLDQPISEIFSWPLPDDKAGITVRMLLSHSSGFAAWEPFYLNPGRVKKEMRKIVTRKRIMEGVLVCRPGEAHIYSDLGFIMLEWVIEKISGIPLHLFVQNTFYQPLSLKRIYLYNGTLPDNIQKDMIAATEKCPWRKRIIHGEVHDENAYFLGGYSGHAGLFSCAGDILAIMNMLRGHYLGEREDYFRRETVREFFRRQDIIRDCFYALGWDTPSMEGSSSGMYFSPNSIGHLGFTGTSLWMDLDRDLTVILLTNRVHPTRENQKIKEFRPLLHDLIVQEIYGRQTIYTERIK
ncbi:MAG: serine hydrolase [Deltaproteobacteria bacterium]|nr:serine hydrolase [Deltaproteobacteria bacterium]